TGRKFKVSDKGRFAFIQLSDMGGIFEVSVFNEGLLAQQRDHLENGKILLIGADAKIDEAGMRLIAQTIAPLDEVLLERQKKHGAAFRIVVSEAQALPTIQNLLGAKNGRGA